MLTTAEALVSACLSLPTIRGAVTERFRHQAHNVGHPLRLLLECLAHSPAYSPHPSMQSAVFLRISRLLASSLLIHGSYTHGSHT